MKFFILYFIFITQAYALTVGAERSSFYLPLVKNKKVALVVNQTSQVNGQHLIDFLLDKKVQVKKLFALEHGLRGNLDAGEDVQNGVDVKTGLPVISLYGKQKGPSANDLKDIDVIIFDIQDVGVRFYTYISSLFYVLQSCGKYKKECLIFDRPNPRGDEVSGPVLDMSLRSFVGMYPIPVVYGLTMGELAKMIVGQRWVKESVQLTIVALKGWKRSQGHLLPVRPSPNLPNEHSIMWYPTLALFEPTFISIGRGTYHPFEVIGYPDKKFGKFSFVPKSIKGMSKFPKHENKRCYGIDLRKSIAPKFTLKYLVDFYRRSDQSKDFFQYPTFFNKLIGDSKTLSQIQAGVDYKIIEASWEKDLEDYKQIREKYLIYE